MGIKESVSSRLPILKDRTSIPKEKYPWEAKRVFVSASVDYPASVSCQAVIFVQESSRLKVNPTELMAALVEDADMINDISRAANKMHERHGVIKSDNEIVSSEAVLDTLGKISNWLYFYKQLGEDGQLVLDRYKLMCEKGVKFPFPGESILKMYAISLYKDKFPITKPISIEELLP